METVPAPQAAGTRVAVGLGSNLGDRRAMLRIGRRGVARCLAGFRCSSIYETEPLHEVDQPRFLNACMAGRTLLGPDELLVYLQRLERDAGRESGARFGPRKLDLDLLVYGERRIETRLLTVPHPRMAERAFVLVPLAEIAGDWVHPELGCTVVELRDRVSRRGVRCLLPVDAWHDDAGS